LEDLSREGKFQDSRNLESPDASRSFGHSLEPEVHRRDGGFQDSGKAAPTLEAVGRLRRRQATSQPTKPDIAAANHYRRQTGITPNPIQRQLLADQVIDLALWEITLEHWLSHGWNPRNIAGQLDLYQRGGPSGCHYCRKDPLNQTLENLNQLRKELTYG